MYSIINTIFLLARENELIALALDNMRELKSARIFYEKYTDTAMQFIV